MLALMVMAGAAGAMCVGLTKVMLPVLERLGAAQPIHEDRSGHAHKAGTPTMGGVAIVASVVLAYVGGVVLLGMEASRSSWLVLALTVVCGSIGFADDLVKVRSGRNQGISARAKFLALALMGAAFAVAVVVLQPSAHAPIIRLGSVVLVGSPIVAVVWIVGLVLATDGMDGLAAGSAVVSFAAMAAMAVLIGTFPGYGVADGTPLAALAACFAGSSLGFLRWNAHPARIFMGDTGSLALGAGLAGLAAVTGTGVLLPLAGCLFVVEALSVIVLVVAFRAFGRRPFHAPIHHQFERPELREPVLVLRLWCLSAGGAAASVVLFRAGLLAG